MRESTTPSSDQRPTMNEPKQTSLGPPLLMLMLMLAMFALGKSLLVSPDRSVPYSEFEQQLKAGKISLVTVGDHTITGALKAADAQGAERIVAVMVEPATAERLARFDVPYQRVHDPAWLTNLLSWLMPMVFLYALWSVAARRFKGGFPGAGLMGIGESKAKIYMEKSTGVRFDDVAGVDEAKLELEELVAFLKDPKAHGRLGARIPKGVLLMGPTGTGKTLLARAVAGEAGVPFFSISGSAFIEMFVGVGAARVRDLFEQARQNAPAIIFIDELDALGKARGAVSLSGGHDEREQTLNQLLVEMDGFDPSVGVVLLAATNRPEVLDPALLRAGRFDRQVLVDRPDRIGRLAILKLHARKIQLSAQVDLEQVAALTVGFAGADLANLVNEAALVATRRQGTDVTLDDFTLAMERITAGIEKKHGLLDPRERQLVATHELGHALTAMALQGVDKVHKVSIVPRGIGALGYTLQRPTQDRHLLRRGELMDKLTVLLGGRASEILVFGEPSTGAADDLARATDIARDMVLRLGMDAVLGPVVYADHAGMPWTQGQGHPDMDPRSGPQASSRTALRIDDAVHDLLQEAQARATALLQARRDTLERCVQALLAQETLDETQLTALAGATPLPTHPPTP
jgi:cell division protease FtsH